MSSVRRWLRIRLAACAFLLAALMAGGGAMAHAAASSSLTDKINDTQNHISQLQKDISQLQSQLSDVAQQKQTLKSALQTLKLSKDKLQEQVELTQAQIEQVDSQIGTLSTSIASATGEMATAQEGVGDVLRNLNESDESPLALILLSGSTLSGVFSEASSLAAVRAGLEAQVSDLSDLKTSLQGNKTDAEQKHSKLASLEDNLNSQQQALSATIDSQNKLLSETDDKESNYQSLIVQKQKQEEQFESDLNQYQSQLTTPVNTSSLPSTGAGVLGWPLAGVWDGACSSNVPPGYASCITQYFGNTPFATKNPQIYNGAGHDGVDLRAAPGTPVLSAGDGTVLGVGNTDLTCPGASYGKWIFIRHTNGLSTLYGHLSVISVKAGQAVKRGEVIGYSGQTGYATGPHLHFTVMASDASHISSGKEFPSKGCPGTYYTMPVGPLDSYLNPLSYL